MSAHTELARPDPAEDLPRVSGESVARGRLPHGAPRLRPGRRRKRLTEIGEFTLGEENLGQMRRRQLRDPGTPSGAVEHCAHLIPGRPADPDVPVRLHRERGITEPRPCLISIHGGG